VLTTLTPHPLPVWMALPIILVALEFALPYKFLISRDALSVLT